MADYFFHYTSRVVAQMVASAGVLLPGPGGLYLSDELFRSCAEAADALAIPVFGPDVNTGSGRFPLTKPIEVVCCIPAIRLDRTLLSGPNEVGPWREPRTNRVIYWGRGQEFKYALPVEVEGLPWVTLIDP